MPMLAQAMAGTLGALALASSALSVSAQTPSASHEATPPAASSASDEAPAMDAIALGRDDRARMTVPVHIGEAGPFAFMVDTGAQRTVLTEQTARTLGLVPSGRATLVSVAGLQAVDLVSVAEMSLGKRRFVALEAPLVDGTGLEAEGIVGLDGLQDQKVEIDFQRHRMLIGDAPAADQASGESFDIVVSARRRSGQLVMTEAMIDGVRTDVMIDTGSDASIGNLALQRALGRHQGEQAQLIAVTGQAIAAQVGHARALTIGGMTIGNLTFAFADTAAFTYLKLNRRPALLLGMRDLSAFRRVAIDFSRRKILFDFAPDPATTLAARR